jgi:hypothetical protein
MLENGFEKHSLLHFLNPSPRRGEMLGEGRAWKIWAWAFSGLDAYLVKLDSGFYFFTLTKKVVPACPAQKPNYIQSFSFKKFISEQDAIKLPNLEGSPSEGWGKKFRLLLKVKILKPIDSYTSFYICTLLRCAWYVLCVSKTQKANLFILFKYTYIKLALFLN